MARARVGARDRAIARAHGRVFAHDLSLAIAYDLGPDFDLDLDIAHCLALARESAKTLDHALDPVLRSYPDIAGSIAKGMVLTLRPARQGLADRVVRSRAAAESISSGGSTAAHVANRPVRFAAQLTQLSVRLLPAPARARYFDQLLDEVYALAEDGAGQWRQLACALRQIVPGVWRLRVALRTERATGRAAREGS